MKPTVTVQDGTGKARGTSAIIIQGIDTDKAEETAARVKALLAGENELWHDGYNAGRTAEQVMHEQGLR